MTSPLSTYREGSLHAALKAMYARPGDRVETSIEGFVVDVVRPDELVEVQTGSFASAAVKLRLLARNHRIRLVYPIVLERRLVRVDVDGAILYSRRSPRRGSPVDLFDQLVAFPELLASPNFSLDLVLIREEEIRGPVPPGARFRRPRQWWRLDRRLLEVVDTLRVVEAADLVRLLPPLPDPFTSADVSALAGCPRRLASRAVYCLERSGASGRTGRLGRLVTYRLGAGRGQPAAIVATDGTGPGDQ